MQYYIVRNGQQAGPFDVDQLTAEGLTPQTLVWCEGMTQWQPAHEIAEVSALFAYNQPPTQPIPPQPQQPTYSAPVQGQPLYGQPQQPAYGQQPIYGQPQQPMPETYLAWSIVVTLLCCMPFGIVAIIKSSNVSSAYARGDYAEAQRNSESAKKWCIWSAVLALVFSAIYCIYIFLGISSGLSL